MVTTTKPRPFYKTFLVKLQSSLQLNRMDEGVYSCSGKSDKKDLDLVQPKHLEAEPQFGTFEGF